MHFRYIAIFPLAAVLAVSLGADPPSKETRPPELVASTEPRTPEMERKGFHLPPGFEAQLVACEPDIHKPMNLAFDDLGRLWVTSSLEYPFPAKDGTTPRDRVIILDQFGPDGRAGKITTFADGLNIPIGVLPLTPNEALVHSIPKVWRLTDTDGDGKADQRAPAYGTYGSQDTHGMTSAFTQGFDGWIYACHGFSNTSTVEGSDGQPITMQSGNTYRMRPDGSHLEWFTHGQVNPFGIAIDPLGNLFTCDCHSRPIYQLLRGAYYPSFGKAHDGLGFGPAMMNHDHGSTGIGGITYYAADHFPEPWRDTIFIGNVVTSRINHDRLERHGSTLQAIMQPDFLVSDDPWFRPVDITLGPDGALYVADFYNRIIGHYEVPLTHPGRDRERGRIWRIVYRGSDGKGQPRSPRTDWTRANVDDLIADLEHPNLAVRLRSTHQLATRSDATVSPAILHAISSSATPWTKTHGIWVLERRGDLPEEVLKRCAEGPVAEVRVHAMRILSERPELTTAHHDLLVNALKDEDAFVQRAAADALGRHPSAENLKPLLALRHGVPKEDTHLLHVARMALRDQLVPQSARKTVDQSRWSNDDARALADVALGVPTAEAARFLLRHAQRRLEDDATIVRFVHHIARFGNDEPALLAFVQADRPRALGHQAALLRAFHQGSQERETPLSPNAKAWAELTTRALIASTNDNEALTGLELAGLLKQTSLQEELRDLANLHSASEARRDSALKALAAIDSRAAVELLGRIIGEAGEPASLREQAVNLLAQGNQAGSRAALLKTLPLVPGRLQSTIGVALASSKEGGEALLGAIAAGKASARLLQERPIELRLRLFGVSNLDARLSKLLAGLPPADTHLQDLINHRRQGFAAITPDVAAGAKVFEKHCVVCHQLGGKGARIGPQLDGVGVRGPDRLMEDVLDPNRNIDQAFRMTTLALKDGEVASGLLLREEGEVLILADAQGKEVRVPASNVEERSLSQLSPMPAGLADQISEPDFYNLLGYLIDKAR